MILPPVAKDGFSDKGICEFPPPMSTTICFPTFAGTITFAKEPILPAVIVNALLCKEILESFLKCVELRFSKSFKLLFLKRSKLLKKTFLSVKDDEL